MNSPALLAALLLTLGCSSPTRATASAGDDLTDCHEAADSTALSRDARELCHALPLTEATARLREPKFRTCLERGKRAAYGDFFRLQSANAAVAYGKPAHVLADCLRDAKSGAREDKTANAGVRVLSDLNIHTRDASWPAGLSGLAYHAPSGEFVTIADTYLSPQAFSLSLRATGGGLDASILRTRLLEPTAGTAEQYPDHEDLAVFRNGDLLLSSERGRWPLRWLRTSACAANEIPASQTLPIPPSFESDMTFNAGLEGIAVAPSERYAIIANEKPLMHAPELKVNLAVIALGDLDNSRVGPRFDYTLDALPGTGISAMTFADASTLVVLERGWDEIARRNSIRLYLVRFKLDANGLPVSAGPKTLLSDVETLLPQFAPGFRVLDNFEGVAFGPDLADGSRTLFLVTDNNQNPYQRTVFLALAVRLPGVL